MASPSVKNIQLDYVQNISNDLGERKSSLYEMLTEANNVKKKKSENVLCNICKQKYFSEITLNLHINSVHKGVKPFPCHLCEARFSQKSNLKKHVASVHDKEKPYMCDVCYKKFAAKRNLNGHTSSVHEKKKPFHCSICNASFG